MPENRYEPFNDEDDTWAIIDRFTGWPVNVNGVLQLGMDMDKAARTVEALDLLDARKRADQVRG